MEGRGRGERERGGERMREGGGDGGEREGGEIAQKHIGMKSEQNMYKYSNK